MKYSIYILFTYLMVLHTLPSVRAVKVILNSESSSACKSSEQADCDNSKFIMSLNFSPLQFVNVLDLKPELSISEFKLIKEQSCYEKIFISKYQQSIWHPPKFFI